MKPITHVAILTVLLTPLSAGHASPVPADSVLFCQPVDLEQWERDRARRPAAKRLQDLNVGEPRTVRLFYVLPNDRPYRAEVVESMKTGILELQSFFAEQMAAHGYGNKTFRIETDDLGEPIVHHVDGLSPASAYGYTKGEITQAFDNSANIILIVIDSPITSQHGLGTGTKDSGWAIIYGGWNWFAAVHELGHTFGLHHDFRDDAYIMSYGRANRSSAQLSACAAEFLAVHPYLNPDVPLENESPPTIELISPTLYPQGAESVPVRLRVRNDEGLHQVILFVNTKRALGVTGPEVKACRGLAGETDTIVEFYYDGKTPSDRVFSGSPIYTSFSDPLQHEIYVVVVDTDGNRTNTFSPISFTLEVGNVQAEIVPLSERTPQVRDAIVDAVPGISSASDVTAGHLAEITSLNLSRKSITALKTGDFDGLTALTSLNLSGNQFTSLPAGIFDNRTALTNLSLGGFTWLPAGIFDQLSALTSLSLDNFTMLPADIFDNLTALASLRLNSNQLTSLPADIFDNLTALTSLSLNSNQLTSLPADIFDNLTALTSLSLRGNRLPSLPADIFDNLTALTNLTLGGYYTSLPADIFDNLTALIGLELWGELTTLPSGIFDQLINLRYLDLYDNDLSSLPSGIFDQLTNLTSLNFEQNQFTTLPAGIFDNLTALTRLGLRRNRLSSLPSGIFYGLTALERLGLHHNPVDPLPLTVSLEKVGEDQFRAVAPTGAPFDIVLPLTVANGTIGGGATTLTIPAGSLESETLTVTRTSGTTAAVTVDMGTLPGLPANHQGYALVKSANLPLVFTEFGGTVLTPVCDRTPQVQTAILGVLQLQTPSPSTCGEVTEAHLATGITSLYLNGQGITTLKVGDFDGLTSLTELRLNGNQLTTLPEDIFDGLTALTTLYLYGNQLTTLPEDIFDGLTTLTDLRMIGNQFTALPDGLFEGLNALTTLYLHGNSVDPLPLTVSLEKFGTDPFKAVAPSGAPFEIVLPLSVANGSISGGATTITVPAGSLESQPLTVTRTPGTTFAVTVDIGTLPGLPANHSGYTLVKSADLPITVTEGDIPGTSVLTLTVGENPNDPFNSYPFGRIGYNQHPSPDWNLGTLSSPEFVIDGISYTVTSLYYMTSAKRLTLRTSPDLPRGFVLYLGSQQFNSVDSGFTHRHSSDDWENVDLNWSVGQTVQVRIVETTPMLLGPPTNLQATTQNENVMLTWELPANSDPTTLPVNEYEVRISTDSGTTWEYGWRELFDSGPGEENRNGITIGSNSADVHHILSNGTEYTFEVRALGGDGSGDAASVTLVLDRITPLSSRTPQVRDAIVAAVPSVNSANDVTKEHLAAITSLRIRSRDITELRIEDFLDLPALTTLSISGTKLSSLPRFIFDNLPTLTDLYLGGNNDLNELPWRIFDKLPALKKLYLNENGMPSLRSGVFDNLTALEELGLGGNDLRSLPSGVFDNLTALKKLNMSYNELVSLRAGVFDNNIVMENLHLYYNDLNSLPPGIFDNNTALKTLTIWENNLSALSAGIFDNNTALTNLSIGFNRFSSLPSGIFNKLTNLQGLGLIGNRFSSLPNGVFNGLSALTSLNVSQNSVDRLPLTISLEKVGGDQFKAVAPTGAPFDIVLPLTVANGTISGGATTITIPKGSVESEPLTVTRAPGSSAPVTADVGTLPRIPSGHVGYTLVKSSDLPLEIFSSGETGDVTAATDFNGDGRTDFVDFFLFADAYGGTDAKFDLDGNDTVDFADFFKFVDAFSS